MTDARTASVFLLRCGTLPFGAFLAWALVDSDDDGAAVPVDVARHLHVALVCHAGIILAFIGGLQQAAVMAGRPPASAAAAITAIFIAIVGMGAILSSAVHGARPAEPLVLALAYSWQAFGESLMLSPLTRHAMLHAERVAPMLLACVALLASAYRTAALHGEGLLGGAALIATVGALTAPTNLLLVLELVRPTAHALAAKRAVFGEVAVGTTNACKLAAVRQALALYPEAARKGVVSFKVPSNVPDQPIGMELAGSHFDVCVVSCFDGHAHHLGLSCAFEIPPTILRHVTAGGMDLTQACNAAGITQDPKLGEKGGLIGLLSSNRLTREEYTVQALCTALFFAAVEGRPWYKPAQLATSQPATT